MTERRLLAERILAMLAADKASSFEAHIEVLQLAIDFRKIDIARRRERERRKRVAA